MIFKIKKLNQSRKQKLFKTKQFKLKLDLLAFLGSGSTAIHLNNEYLTHTAAGQEALTQKVITNFKNAISPF